MSHPINDQIFEQIFMKKFKKIIQIYLKKINNN